MESKQYNRRDFLSKTSRLLGIAGIVVATGSMAGCEKSIYKSYVVRKSKCNACLKCVYVCKYSSIDMIDELDNEGNVISTAALINQAKCYKCGKCIDVCPEKAISLIAE